MIIGKTTITVARLAYILKISVTDVVKQTLAKNGILKVWISIADARRRYGRRQVDRWISEGLFEPVKGKVFLLKSKINLEKLEAVAAASNRITYQPVADR